MRIRDEWDFNTIGTQPPDLVDALTPVNLHEEFEKWLVSKDKSYSPQFLYDEKLIRKTYKSAVRLIMVLAHLAEEYLKYDDWQAELTLDLLVTQVEDLNATIEILEAVLKDEGMDKLEVPVYRLFGKPTLKELDLSTKLTYERSGAILLDNLIDDDEQGQFSREKLREIATGFLHDFKGILTQEEGDKLTEKRLNTEQIADVLERVVQYISDHSELDELHVRLYISEYADRFGVAPAGVEAKMFNIEMPTEDLFADQLLQTVAHELNTHLRVMISTAKLQDVISPYFRPSMTVRTQRGMTQEGFATLNGESCIDDAFCCWFEPMLMLAPYFVKQGHNFAETVRFIYESYDIDPSRDDPAMHRDIWTLMQMFYGLGDTSKPEGYVLPWMQVYFLGPIRTLKELTRVETAQFGQFEEPLSLMRYSELPLEFIPKINHLEKQLGHKLAFDPFARWDFANLKPDVITPTEYCKHLLLDI